MNTKLLAALGALLCAHAVAQSTALIYQGRLGAHGAAANGAYDFQFLLHNAPTGTNQVGLTLTQPAVVVNDGTFSVSLDFGTGVFSGAPRWLEIGVRTNGSAGPYTVLSPRQLIGTTPYAMRALDASNLLGSVGDWQIPPTILRLNGNQTLTGSISFSNLFGAPFAIGNTNTNKVAWLNADLLDGLDSASFARSNHTHSALEVTSGILSDARLSPNVPLLNDHQAFTGSNTFSGVVIASNALNIFAGSFTGNGGGLSNLNGAALSGVIPGSALPATVARLGSNQTFTGAVAFNPATGAPFQVGAATLVTNLNADLLDGLSAAAFWNIGGNAGTTAANFVGTTDNQPLELRANSGRVLRIVPTVGAPNIVGGSAANSVGTNVLGAFVGGGTGNSVTGNYASVVGGQNNSATNVGATVLGGVGNTAGGQYSVAGGRSARATHDGTYVWADSSSAAAFTSAVPNTVVFRAIGGIGIGTNAPASALHVAGTIQSDNLKVTSGASAGAVLVSDASGNSSWQQAGMRTQTNANSPNLIGGHLSNTVAIGVVGATIGGGGSPAASNYVSGNYGTVAGGAGNRVTGVAGTIGGGTNNIATNYASVAGGLQNSATGEHAAVGGGTGNTAAGFSAVVAGGSGNSAASLESAVGGGFNNRAGGQRSFVGGGAGNNADGNRSAIGGGEGNRATNSFGTIGGGIANTNYGSAATIGGGQNNAATNLAAIIPGGSGNVAGGQFSFAAGRNARALHDGAFVWSDSSSSGVFSSGAANQFLIRAAGGVGINGAPEDAALDVEGNMHINDGDIFLRAGSDRNHGLGWSGVGKPFASAEPDGPAIYGWAGGLLGSKSGGERYALAWDSNRRVGVGGTATLSNPLTVDGAGTTSGGVPGFNEVAARFRNSSAGHTAVSIDGGVNSDAVLYFSENSDAKWGLRHDSDDGHKFQLRYHDAFNATYLTVETNGFVGVGAGDPSAQLHVQSPNQTVSLFQNSRTDGTWLGLENNGGGRRWNLIATGSGNSEGAGHLLVHGNNGVRMIVRDDGNVGIGTMAPGERLEVGGFDPTVRVRNFNDAGGGFLGNTFGALQFGMYNASTNLWGVIPPNTKRSFFGVDANGRVGSMLNNFFNPVWRNFLDDGNGNMSVNTSGALNFGNQTRQMVNLWGANYGIGVQNNTMYYRTDGNFAWYRFGGHSDTELSAGGGSELMRLNSGGLVVQGTFVSSSDRNVKTDFAPVNSTEVLHKVLALPIRTWRYTNDETGARHLGPMAQDFHAAFKVGSDDRHIATVDADGVALAAIQGLYEVIEARDARIKELEQRLAAAERQAAPQQKLNADWESRLKALENQRGFPVSSAR